MTELLTDIEVDVWLAHSYGKAPDYDCIMAQRLANDRVVYRSVAVELREALVCAIRIADSVSVRAGQCIERESQLLLADTAYLTEEPTNG